VTIERAGFTIDIMSRREIEIEGTQGHSFQVECRVKVANIVDASTKRPSIGTLKLKLLERFFSRTHTNALVELISLALRSHSVFAIMRINRWTGRAVFSLFVGSGERTEHSRGRGGAP